jgi:hypothetical protein
MFRKLPTLLIALCLSLSAQARVPIDYPGLLSGDHSLPGIPDDDPSYYGQTLAEWAVEYGLPLSPGRAEEVINEAYHAGFQQSPTYTYEYNGAVESGVYYDVNTPIWHLMRDILFLETLQNSVRLWEYRFLNTMDTQFSSQDFQSHYSDAQDHPFTHISNLL